MKPSKLIHRFETFIDTYHKYILVAIFLCAFCFRFYNTPARYSFDLDSVRDQIVTTYAASELQLPLTGSFSSAGSFTFGPVYFYHLILFHLILKNPYSVWIANGVISLIVLWVMYLTGKNLYDKKLGLLAAALTAFSPAMIVMGTSSSNPNLVTLYAVLTLLILVYIKQQRSIWWLYLLLGICIGMAINAHYQSLPLLLLVLYVISPSTKQWRQSSKRVLLVILGLIIPSIPLLFFNLNNHWQTVRNFLYYYQYGKYAVYVPNSWKIYLFDFWPSISRDIFGIPLIATVIMVLVMGIGLSLFLYHSTNRKLWIVFIGFFLLNFFYLRFHWGERHPNYIYFLYPIIILSVGLVLRTLISMDKVYLQVLGVAFFIMLIGFSISTYPFLFRDNTALGYTNQAKILQKIYKTNNISFFTCRADSNKTKALAMSYVMNTKQTFGENKALAYPSELCDFPPVNGLQSEPATVSAHFNAGAYPYSFQTEAFDFSSASSAAIHDAGWEKIEPYSQYQSFMHWWFDEKP